MGVFTSTWSDNEISPSMWKAADANEGRTYEVLDED